MDDANTASHVRFRREPPPTFAHRLERTTGHQTGGWPWHTSFYKNSILTIHETTSVLARSRTWSSTFAGSRARIRHTPRTHSLFTLRQCPAEESNLVRQFRGLPCSSVTPAGLLDRVSRPGIEPGPGPSEGPMRSATPSGRTHKEPTTGLAPASCGLQDRCLSVRPRRQAAGARGVEPRAAGLESACSPRSTLLSGPSGLAYWNFFTLRSDVDFKLL